jgi:hypothetical protein
MEERVAAAGVKRDKPILVVLGNPPYNAFAGVGATKEERGLAAPYKNGLVKTWGIKKFNLDDLYVRFFRMAEHRIAEQTGRGVVCYISNFSYLHDPSFVVMRQRFLSEFDRLWFDNLNGDSRETGKRTPDGKPDPSVFSTQHNKAGIRVGTAVGLMVRKKERGVPPVTREREFWGVAKRSDLVATLNVANFDAQYQIADPSSDNRYSFRPENVRADYLGWPRLADLAIFYSNGLMEKRGGALIGIDRSALESRTQVYYNLNLDWEHLRALETGLTKNAAGFDAKKTRENVLKVETFSAGHLVRYAVRPLDTRWSYYSAVSPLWNRARPDLWNQWREGNAFLMSRPAGVAEPEGVPLSWTLCLGDNDYQRGHAYYFPVRLFAVTGKKSTSAKAQPHLLPKEESLAQSTANLSASARTYLADLGITNPDADIKTAALIWMHALGMGYSPAYLSENADGIRSDWPRVPLPAKRHVLEASAALGEQVARLLDTEAPALGVTAGDIRPELRRIGVISHEGGGALQPNEMALMAGWGHLGKNGAVMPGKGRVLERDYSPEERGAIQEGAARLGLSLKDAFACLGDRTYDIYLNDVAYWGNVPKGVWGYIIGGYQVMKKWLSYREQSVLGRGLRPEEIREVTDMARRLAAILLLQPSLDANYQACKADTYPWPGGAVEKL